MTKFIRYFLTMRWIAPNAPPYMARQMELDISANDGLIDFLGTLPIPLDYRIMEVQTPNGGRAEMHTLKCREYTDGYRGRSSIIPWDHLHWTRRHCERRFAFAFGMRWNAYGVIMISACHMWHCINSTTSLSCYASTDIAPFDFVSSPFNSFQFLYFVVKLHAAN